MKFKPGDICVYNPVTSLNCYVIMEVRQPDPNPQYSVLNLKNKKTYYAGEDKLTKIGEVSPELGTAGVLAILLRQPELPTEDDLRFLHGRARAKKEAAFVLAGDRWRWEILAQAKPGDHLNASVDGIPEILTFHYVVEKGEKNVFLAANDDGKLLRYTLNVLLGPAAPDKQI